jgi:tRNA (guanine-N7-)-methyltransferase
MEKILTSKDGGAFRKVKSYVLRAGRGTSAQERAYEKYAKTFVVPFAEDAGLPQWEALFGNTNPVTVEIGFGMGIATALVAEANPFKNYLGIEVHRPGIGRLLLEMEKRSLSNIRIIEHDAALVMDSIPASSVDAIHLFFPDPWPKKRHHKRRLIQRPFTDTLAEKLKSGGYLYMVTDWEDYGTWALNELCATPGLVNSCAGFSAPQSWRPQTKFEAKGLAKNHAVRELFFLKQQC